MKEQATAEVGDVVVSKFGNRWSVEAWETLTNGKRAYVLRNKPQETPDASGTVVSGMLPEWAERIERDGLCVWVRPTPKCQCAAWHLTPCDRKGDDWYCIRELGHFGPCSTVSK